MARCPKCGAEASGRFCSECGTPLVQSCPVCHETAPAGIRFCANCGTPFAVPLPGEEAAAPAGSAAISTQGDVVVGRQEIDSSVRIGAQTNIHGNVIVQASPERPRLSLSKVVRRSWELLDQRAYVQVESLLNQAVAAGARDGEVYALLAVALLRGRSPTHVSGQRIAQVEECLRMAMNSPEWHGFAVIAWAVVKHDHFVLQQLDEGEPCFEWLAREAGLQRPGSRERALLQHVQSTTTVQRRVGMRW